MNKTLKYKVFSIYYINEQEYLTKEDKNVLLSFVKNANEKDILNLVEATWWSGDPGSPDFLVAFKEFLKNPANEPNYSSWIANKLTQAQRSGQVEGIAISILIAAILTAGYVAYKNYLSKGARACKDYSGVEKQDCIVKFKKNAVQAKISSLAKGFPLCNKSKNPAQCKAKLAMKIASEKRKLGGVK